jgi:hypothetical protein
MGVEPQTGSGKCTETGKQLTDLFRVHEQALWQSRVAASSPFSSLRRWSVHSSQWSLN